MAITRLIGVCGYAQAGKSSIANVLVEEYGYTKLSFAAKVKDALLTLDPSIPGLDRLSELVRVKGWDRTKQYPEVRSLLQRTGTVARELFGADAWIEALARNEKGVYNPTMKIVIDDVRFVNEARWIKMLRGQVWKVTRPNFDSGVDPDDPTEREVPIINAGEVNILNDLDLESLQERVREYVDWKERV